MATYFNYIADNIHLDHLIRVMPGRVPYFILLLFLLASVSILCGDISGLYEYPILPSNFQCMNVLISVRLHGRELITI